MLKESSILKGSKSEVMLPFRLNFDFILGNYILHIMGIIGKLPLNEISSQKQFIIFHKELK